MSISKLDKWRGDDALNVQRRRMNEALAKVGQFKPAPREIPEGHLIFALDLTASREAGLAQARIGTAAMFAALRSIGAIAVKLIYFRGENECRESGWENDPEILSRIMRQLSCESGETQIARLLRRVLNRADEEVSAVVFVGDHCEEKAGELGELAAALGERRIPVYVFHEIADDDQRSLRARPVFRRIAAASGGVYCEFKPNSGVVLREMLSSVAAFSAAGIEGVREIGPATAPEARQLQKRLLLLGPGNPDGKGGRR